MKDFFANLYEWFGLIPFYSTEMGDHLRGFDLTCTDYIGTPWYVLIGGSMVGITILIYALQYHIIDSSKWNRKYHWWLFALMAILSNFLIAFVPTFNSIQSGEYCSQLNLGIADCIGFGISNSIWSLLLLILISSTTIPRRFSTNSRDTTFWKP